LAICSCICCACCISFSKSIAMISAPSGSS
jgi:hypothetical protein